MKDIKRHCQISSSCLAVYRLKLEPVNKSQLESRNSSQYSFWIHVAEFVGWWWVAIISLHLELLHQSSKEDVELLLSQCLAQADSLSNSERCNPFIRDKLPFGVQEPVWIEGVRILEVLRVIHDVVETAKDNRSLGYDVVANGNISRGVVRNSWRNQCCRSEALQEDSIDVVKFWSVIQAWESVVANNLIKNTEKLTIFL